MKKALLGGVLVLAGGYVGSTMYFGSEAESQFKQSVTVIDKALQKQIVELPAGPKFQLSLKDYDKGLLSSSAKLNIKVDFDGIQTPIPMKNLSYDLDLKISHGPFIVALGKPGMAYASSTVELPKKMIDMAKKQLSKDSTLPMMDFSLLINLDQSSRFMAKVPKFTIAPKQIPGKLVWKGMDVFYNMSKDMKSFKGAAVINGLDLDSPFANATVSKMDMTYDLNATQYGLWVGTGTFSLPTIKVSARGSTIFDLSNLKFDSAADVNNGLLKLSMNTSFASIKAKDQSFGPANLDFELKNLDANSFVKVQQTLQELNNAKLLPKSDSKKLMAQLDKQLPNLLSKGAELSVKNFKFQMPEGLMSGALNVKMSSDIKVTKIVQLADYVHADGQFQVPSVLLENMLVKQASRKIRNQQLLLKLNNRKKQEAPSEDASVAIDNVPVQLLSKTEINDRAKQQVDKQLNKLLDEKLLIKESNSFVFKFKFDKGHLFVNGKPFDPALFNQ